MTQPKSNKAAQAIGPPPAIERTEGAAPIPDISLYRGRAIYLTAAQSANGLWTGSARLDDESGRVTNAAGEFATANEARAAALSQAVAAIDDENRFRGKP
ncbi:hypothetical protein [Rugamonas rivuli]|uniref:Uncharacterized protein n=1 Tax=Rugamonas rivuli TaxID=2743358 RepID=A0A843SPB3_9BURK|nr:hypothetical protein [Rugamonas rivuli]MQA23684.1 hypothetical protein [Rugamonas rivuli]